MRRRSIFMSAPCREFVIQKFRAIETPDDRFPLFQGRGRSRGLPRCAIGQGMGAVRLALFHCLDRGFQKRRRPPGPGTLTGPDLNGVCSAHVSPRRIESPSRPRRERRKGTGRSRSRRPRPRVSHASAISSTGDDVHWARSTSDRTRSQAAPFPYRGQTLFPGHLITVPLDVGPIVRERGPAIAGLAGPDRVVGRGRGRCRGLLRVHCRGSGRGLRVVSGAESCRGVRTGGSASAGVSVRCRSKTMGSPLSFGCIPRV